MENLLNALSVFFSRLDYLFIITSIVINYFVIKDTLVKSLPSSKLRTILLSVPKGWRVLLSSTVYGAFLYWVRDYHGKKELENMLMSLFMIFPLHKLFAPMIEAIIKTRLSDFKKNYPAVKEEEKPNE